MNVANKQLLIIRKEFRLSQRAFAEEIGFSKSYVADIERGKVEPSRRFLDAVSLQFGISIDKILLGLEEKITRSLYYIQNTGFLYLFDFTVENLLIAEDVIIDSMYNTPPFVVDMKNKNVNQVYSFLTGKEGSTKKLWNELRLILHNYDKFYIIKNLSLSKINRKAYFLLDFFREIKFPENLIVIDKPSLLEKNHSILLDFAYPIYVGDYLENLLWHKP